MNVDSNNERKMALHLITVNYTCGNYIIATEMDVRVSSECHCSWSFRKKQSCRDYSNNRMLIFEIFLQLVRIPHQKIFFIWVFSAVKFHWYEIFFTCHYSTNIVSGIKSICKSILFPKHGCDIGYETFHRSEYQVFLMVVNLGPYSFLCVCGTDHRFFLYRPLLCLSSLNCSCNNSFGNKRNILPVLRILTRPLASTFQPNCWKSFFYF